jgi:hypothetical protein
MPNILRSNGRVTFTARAKVGQPKGFQTPPLRSAQSMTPWQNLLETCGVRIYPMVGPMRHAVLPYTLILAAGGLIATCKMWLPDRNPAHRFVPLLGSSGPTHIGRSSNQTGVFCLANLYYIAPSSVHCSIVRRFVFGGNIVCQYRRLDKGADNDDGGRNKIEGRKCYLALSCSLKAIL